ncbi:hypothetical protein AVEN_180148-1 [Araneus ventricosus]|uniref:Uncharacterized protein n=1 Tax=Araneus ventricosus TaxID=182803 RepID=A0A4Y2D5N3_ARAVE|nr:hypothetical protein AVEN_180148-1 [Araneus ventricosus]
MEIFLELPGKTDSPEFKISFEDYFTIRRKERAHSGVALGMIIEQFLIKSMKVEGGETCKNSATPGGGLARFPACPLNPKPIWALGICVCERERK